MLFMKKFFILLLFLSTQSLIAQNLISSQLLNEYNTAQLLFQFGIPADNGIKVYKVLYQTPDVQGVPDTASGVLVLPDIEEPLPIVAYHHGTTSPKENVPSRESFIVAELYFAGKGYVTTSADFLGLGDSRGFHPYLHAATQASASIDLIRAAQIFCASESIELTNQLFITGYSQGGHAAMSTFRALETENTEEFTVTAAAPMSGPYNLTGSLRDDILSDAPYLFPSYLVYTIKGLQTAYGNLYTDVGEIFLPEYVDMVNRFNNESDYDLNALNEEMLALLEMQHGAAIPRFLFQETLITDLINDDRSNPILAALYDNNVFDWTPQAPTRLYYCEADEQVPFENAIFTDSLMNANGANDVRSLSMGEDLDHNGCAVPAILDAEEFFSSFLPISASTTTAISNLNIYPNPVTDFITIDTPISSNFEITIFDELGRQILQSNSTRLPANQLSNGIYFLRFQAADAIWIRKIMVQR